MKVGKTPYARFDKNDYSVPHTHVRRLLEVIATDERVRTIDPEQAADSEPLADHPRTFDRDQRVEDQGHLGRLAQEKRRAHQSRGFDRLFAAVPAARTMMERLAERGDNLGAATSGLLQMLDQVGANLLERAVARVLARDQPNLRAVHHEIDRLRHEAGQPPALCRPDRDRRRRQCAGSTPSAGDLRPTARRKGHRSCRRMTRSRLHSRGCSYWAYSLLSTRFGREPLGSLESSSSRAPNALAGASRIGPTSRGLGAFKPFCDFDWKWPKRIDRVLLEEILTLRFIAEGANVILLGPNGVGKTMLLRQRRPSRPARWSRSGRPLCQRSAR